MLNYLDERVIKKYITLFKEKIKNLYLRCFVKVIYMLKIKEICTQGKTLEGKQKLCCDLKSLREKECSQSHLRELISLVYLNKNSF